MGFITAGYDGTVDEVQFAKLLHRYSVVGAEDFKATTQAGDRIVAISDGTALGPGTVDVATAIPNVQFAAAAAGTTRWDLVALRRDWQPPGGASSITIIQGGSAKGYPAVGTAGTAWNRRPGILDDQPLYLQEVNGTSLGARVDLRVWAGGGGLYAKDDLARFYMDAVGTEINVNGTIWSMQLGDNDAPGWVRVISADGAVNPMGGGALVRSDGTPNINFGDTALRVNIDVNTGGPWTNRRGSGLECPVPGVYFISGRLLTDGPAGRYGTLYAYPDKADMKGSLTWTEDAPGAAYGGISFSGTFICPTGPAFWFSTTAYNNACTIRPASRVHVTRISTITTV